MTREEIETIREGLSFISPALGRFVKGSKYHTDVKILLAHIDQLEAELAKALNDNERNYTDGHSAGVHDCGDVYEKYQELIYAVEKKYPNETRHETALKYIRRAESHRDNATAKKTENGGD